MTDSLLTLTGLSVSRGDNHIIHDLDLTVNRGDRLMIRGDNGCGKTTLLKTVARLIPYQKGIMEYRGRSLGWVPQEGVISRFPISSREVVMIGTAAGPRGRKKRQALAERMMALTGSLSLADRCFHHLSGGEKQRVSLARCLCQQADLLLLDEPASYLDRESRLGLDDLFGMIQKETGAALMLVTHDPTLFNSRDWVVRTMEGGRLC